MLARAERAESVERLAAGVSCRMWDDLGLRPVHYRVLWWLIGTGGLVEAKRGWIEACAGELKVHRVSVWRAMHKLEKIGLLREVKKGLWELREDFFFRGKAPASDPP